VYPQAQFYIVKMKPQYAVSNSIFRLPFKLVHTHLTEGPQTQQTLLHLLQQQATSYYVSQTNTLTGCEGERSEIIVIVNPRPALWKNTLTLSK
jgi:hypothetical protein